MLRFRLLFPFLVASLLLAGHTPAAHASAATIVSLTLNRRQATVNGETVALDTAPVLDEAASRTFVPVRFIGESLGAYIGWDSETEAVTYLGGDTRIILRIGRKTAEVNGQEAALDAAPYIDENGRTLVPVRFVSEQMGAAVSWDGSTSTVTLTAPWVGRVILLQDYQFSPDTRTVAPGTRITWVNLDDEEHDVLGSDFESPVIAPGEAYSRTFSTAGIVHIGCSFHDGMTATITVQ
jgi:plastocyanin